MVHDKLIIARLNYIVTITKLFYVSNNFKMTSGNTGIGEYFFEPRGCISSLDSAIFVKYAFFLLFCGGR